jgi:hypothetical protein
MPTRPFVRLKSIVSNTVNRPSSRTVTSTTRAVIPCSLSVCGQTRHSIRESESDDGRGLSTRIALFGSHRRTRQLKARQRLTRSPLAPAGPHRLVHAIANEHNGKTCTADDGRKSWRTPMPAQPCRNTATDTFWEGETRCDLAPTDNIHKTLALGPGDQVS